MKAFLRTFVLSAFALIAKSSFAGEIFHRIIDEEMRVLSGISETALYRNRLEFMSRVQAIEVRIGHSSFGTCNARPIMVTLEYNEFSPRQRVALNAYNRVILPRPGLLGVIVHFDNPLLSNTYCRVVALGVENPNGTYPNPSPSPTPNPGEEVNLNEFQYVGLLSYDGGFNPDLSLPVAPVNPVTHIWLRIPNFCEQLEVLEVQYGANTEWIRTTALTNPKNVFLLNTQGKKVGGVRTIVNGPRSNSCEIPVYMRILGQENPYEP